MRALSCLVFVFLVTQRTGAQEDRFLACVQLRDAAYQQARDALLADPNRQFLEQKRKDSDWLHRVQAEILVGWLDNEDYYRELLHGTNARDRTGQRHYSWHRTRRLRAEAIPLLYELILKGGAHSNAESDAGVALLALNWGGAAIDAEMFIAALGDQRVKSAETRRTSANVLAKIRVAPTTLDPDSVFALLVSEKDETMARLLLAAFAQAASFRSSDEKDVFVKRLEAQQHVAAMAGRSAVMRAIGKIGGTQARRVVAAYLEGTAQPSQQRWAILTLSRMEEKAATDMVVNYVNSATVSTGIRLSAISALANCPFGDEVNQALEQIVRTAARSLSERREAIKVLDQIHLKRVDKGYDASDLRKRILGLESDGSGNAELDAELKRVGRRVRERDSR